MSGEPPSHCHEKSEWFNYELVAREKAEIFVPNENFEATKYIRLADRVDYLETFCKSINEYRGE
jgi:hypothetical protein